MLILKIIGAVGLLAFVLFLLGSFDKRCEEKFSHRFFTRMSFAAVAAAVWLIVWGQGWYRQSAAAGGDILNGIVLIIIGAIIVLGLGYNNCKRTNVLYGMGGTALQVSIFGILALLGIVLFVIAILALFVMGTAEKAARISVRDPGY
ncbi:MAG: hypothetical protein WCU88_03950 [Elusimicrobiota bacterium]|jgi:hypothetical protein